MEGLKAGNTIKEKSRSKEKARAAVYQAKYKEKRKIFGNFMQTDDQKCAQFKIAKRIVANNRDTIGEHCISNDDDFVLAVSHINKKIAWKIYHKNLLEAEFAGDQQTLFQANTFSSVPCLIDSDMARQLKSKMKNGKGSNRSRN